ncbi:MAG: hypothetical protein KDE52_16265 [Calditrichaeota bacterium]|nr:hypothetical protein [Calditrichota bacterium]MCB0266951.1 hypothetical protein [Calditrichota bacterium]MCB0301614.1 hypothetical protein [Calditrichota bacterium]MCB9068280.1 hypothetical protein [Calditrichia bacterium]
MKIREIQLQTHDLDGLKTFYRDKLGLPILRQGKRAFTVGIGNSRIKFSIAEDDDKPYYHFAINIPENQLAEAKKWLSERVALIEKDGQNEFRFESWNADAIYFYDPVGNIVELIARHNLRNASPKPFSAESLLSISEIGHPVDNVRLFCEHIRAELRLRLWDGDERTFAAVGDEEGLFIVVPINRPWFPADKPAENYPIAVDVV